MNADTLLNILPLSRNVSTARRNVFTSSVFFWTYVGSKSYEDFTMQHVRTDLMFTCKVLRKVVEHPLVFNGI